MCVLCELGMEGDWQGYDNEIGLFLRWLRERNHPMTWVTPGIGLSGER